MKWEYLELNHAIHWSVAGHGHWETLKEALASLGGEGWEVCATWQEKIILKRPIDPQPQVINNTYNTYTVEKSPIDWTLPPVIC